MSNLSAHSSVDTLYSVAAVRAIDHAAIHKAGIDGYALMTRAAEAALEIALRRFPDATRWQVVCGGGNNAGDGYVLARLAAQKGIAVSLLALVEPHKLGGDAMIASNDFAAFGGAVGHWSGELDPDADLLVDALLGSGLERDVGGEFADAVKAINAHKAPVLALDIPTGLHGDTGAVLGVAVKANVTVTFVGWKTGLFVGDGPRTCGKLYFAGLGIPRKYRQGEAAAMRRLSSRAVRAALSPRPRGAHKGDFGRVVVIGGGPGMPGAVRLAGEAALRSGAGVVSIATHESQVTAVMSGRPELMCHAVSTGDDLESLLDEATTVAIGPGLGRTDWARSLFETVLSLDLPLVVDADALNLLAEAPRQNDRWILTPHPGEAGRLLGISAAEVQSDRQQALAGLQAKYSGTIVLKGQGTLSTARDGVPWMCSAGNPGMASPGMGDVLTGVIAALRAQGLDADDAAALGVSVHARAGDAAARSGERGLLASDLIGELRSWVNR
jgi:NAD(P)H-hydrate epimerase